MVKFVIKRLLIMIPVILGVMLIIFTINEMTPGDPAENALGSNYTEERYQEKVIEMGLDKPFPVRYVKYIIGVVTRFDFGTSYSNGRAIGTMIRERLGVTLALAIVSCAITAVLGLVIGIVAAVKQYSMLDYAASTLAVIFGGIPNFWLAMMSIIIFSKNLSWLPASGLTTWKHWIMPVACCALAPVALIARTTRSSMLDVIRQEYIRTARAKGVNERKIVIHHALKNAIIPVVTVIGVQMSIVIGGSIIIETIFNINGLGMLMMSSINAKDYPAIQGIVLILALIVCMVNLIVDLAYGFIDPRIMAQYTSNRHIRRRRRGKR
ncbi:MAG: ABC transporter permease [Saccharofermentanales bacterium]